MFGNILKIKDAHAELEKLRGELNDIQQQLETVTAENNCLKTKLKKAAETFEAQNRVLSEAQAEVETLKTESLKATEQAADIVAQVGVEEPIAHEANDDRTTEELWHEFHALKDAKAKVDFYRANRNQLYVN